MKTEEELNAIKEELEALSRKLHELTNEELEQVSGGSGKSDYEVPVYTPELEWIEYLITKIDSQE